MKKKDTYEKVSFLLMIDLNFTIIYIKKIKLCLVFLIYY